MTETLIGLTRLIKKKDMAEVERLHGIVSDRVKELSNEILDLLAFGADAEHLVSKLGANTGILLVIENEVTCRKRAERERLN